jgi:hypothetical protein
VHPVDQLQPWLEVEALGGGPAVLAAEHIEAQRRDVDERWPVLPIVDAQLGGRSATRSWAC